MFAYCENNPVNRADPTGKFGLLTGIAITGIVVSSIVGGVVSGLQAACSGGSTADIISSAVIGAATAGAIATVTACAAASSAIASTTVLACAGIGALGETASIVSESVIHKNDPTYKFDLEKAAARVTYAAGIGAVAGGISYGLGSLFKTGIEGLYGMLISTEAAIAVGCCDFGGRTLIDVAFSES